MDLTDMQTAVGLWQAKTFPDHTDHFVKLGKVTEELGELAGALVKSSEPAPRRTDQDVEDEFGDVVIALLALAELCGFDATEAIRQRWAFVSERTYDDAHDRSTSPRARAQRRDDFLEPGTEVLLDGDLRTVVVDSWDDVVQVRGLDKAVARERVTVVS